VNGEDLLNAFVFDDDAVLDKHIHAIAGIKLQPIIFNRLNDFAFDDQTSLGQLIGQASLVGRFEQALAEDFVDFDSGVNDLGGDSLDIVHWMKGIFNHEEHKEHKGKTLRKKDKLIFKLCGYFNFLRSYSNVIGLQR
jgi:hypothetical protein